MPGLKYALVFVCVIIAAFFSFAIAGRYALHAPTAGTYVSSLKLGHATILFGGDMMFDRTVRKVVDEKGGDFIFSCIKDTLKAADVVVANLEGPITPNASVSATSTPEDRFNYTFTFPPQTAELLYSHNVRMVNLGNNHILNFGKGGVMSTIKFLKNAGVGYFGSPTDDGVATSTIKDISFAFINYNEFAPAKHTNILEYVGMFSGTIRQIQEARAGGYIPIVYAHWGVEYATTSSAYSRELAHSFVDAGAEIVIGSHPHVIQEHEIYKGKHIYYSLGNFVFDQYFSEEVRNGLLLKVTFGQNGVIAIKEIPVYLEVDRRTCPVEQSPFFKYSQRTRS